MATEQIRGEEPVKNSIHNLVQTLSVKLDSAARYGLYQQDAKKDGFDDCGALPRDAHRRVRRGRVRETPRRPGPSLRSRIPGPDPSPSQATGTAARAGAPGWGRLTTPDLLVPESRFMFAPAEELEPH